MTRAIAWFARNHVAANLLMLMMIVGGIISLPTIDQRAFPEITVDVIAINVVYLGAAPEEVEQGVCIRIEEEIYGIDGIEEITSSAAEGACGVSAEIMSDYPIDRALSEIKNAVDSITTFPDETEKPIVSHIDLRNTAIEIAVSADASERSLKVYGERIRDSIANLPKVTQVQLKNDRDYEISIEIAESALRRHGLTFDEVVAAVRSGSLDRPGGSIKTSAGEILLRTKGQAYVGPEFEDIVLRTGADGTRLLLSDVATVVDGFDEDDIHLQVFLDIGFVGQAFELTTPMPEVPHSLNEIAAAFQAIYEERYAQSDTAPAEIVSFRVVGLGKAPSVELPEHTGNATADIETRPVSFDSTFVETAIHHREALPVDAAMPGPAIIEEDGATTVVPPGFNATLDRYGILTLRRVNHD